MNIVVVDDQELVYESFVIVLCAAGHKAMGIVGNTQTLEKLRHLKPDLVLLDVDMGPVNGLQLLRQLNNDPTLRHLWVAMLTSTVDAAIEAMARSLGALDYLQKGWDWGHLLPRIEGLLKR